MTLFPLWEKAVFGLLHRSCGELHLIFSQYAKSGTAGSSSAHAAETMQQTELVDLALDCGLATDSFPMARVQGVFARADQTDDGKGGDHALEMHEFLEALVQLSFSRANPRFGEVGKEHEAPNPLPDCLDSMLTKCILRKAKSDTLVKVKKMITKDSAVQTVLRPLRPRLNFRFQKLCNAGSGKSSQAPMLGQDAFLQDLFDSGVTKDLTLRPTAAVKGQVLPEVHSNLSWLDCKGAFVTCQQGGKIGRAHV